ncbi:hypothetical protein SAMN05421823_106119 [Catalinimonas alkaloidigena]|uniref:MetA-pathway of phenol degradation n=1 Tax=Catalinimonas alkaloidigena TaxID=1075417 RepID=A0A1G9KCM9_9BACT|nr:transporter [Catalinimonas alkaloidigena]SDL47342.1 hypothetical protein SAMN05421823_106119 [Catalinimonas alkaloidigena]
MNRLSTYFFTRRAVGYAGLLLVLPFLAVAQTPSDAWMMKQGQACLALTYDYGAFDRYWEGTYLRSNETIATVSRQTAMGMVALGLTDKLNAYVGVPYIHTQSSEPNGGKFQGASGFQDLTLALKYEFIRKVMGPGKLSLFAAGGYAAPISRYLSDYRPYSLGNGTTEWSLRGMANYRSNLGLYGQAMAGYLARGLTKAERDYYYNNGSYYTAWMDVPSAWEYNLAAGMWLMKNSLKLEVGYYALRSTSGDDIRAYNAAQPTNRVDFSQARFSAQYYFKSVKGLGLLAYSSQVLEGRNTGKLALVGGGLTYQFPVWQ